MMTKNQLYLSKFSLLILVFIAFSFQNCITTQKAISSDSSVMLKEPILFEESILPFMKTSCAPCHFPENGREIFLNTEKAVLENISEIISRVQLPSDNEMFMPFKNKKDPLTADQIQLLKDWVAQQE